MKAQKQDHDGLLGAALGAAVGAGVGAAAVALSSPKTRKKLVKKTVTMREQAEKVMATGKKEVSRAKASVTERIADLAPKKKTSAKTLKNNASALSRVKKPARKSA